jgi:hypothetical protein
MILGYANLTVHSIVHKEYKCFGISKLSLIVYEIKAFYFQQCATSVKLLIMENTGFLLLEALKTVVYVI